MRKLIKKFQNPAGPLPFNEGQEVNMTWKDGMFETSDGVRYAISPYGTSTTTSQPNVGNSGEAAANGSPSADNQPPVNEQGNGSPIANTFKLGNAAMKGLAFGSFGGAFGSLLGLGIGSIVDSVRANKEKRRAAEAEDRAAWAQQHPGEPYPGDLSRRDRRAMLNGSGDLSGGGGLIGRMRANREERFQNGYGGFGGRFRQWRDQRFQNGGGPLARRRISNSQLTSQQMNSRIVPEITSVNSKSVSETNQLTGPGISNFNSIDTIRKNLGLGSVNESNNVNDLNSKINLNSIDIRNQIKTNLGIPDEQLDPYEGVVQTARFGTKIKKKSFSSEGLLNIYRKMNY